MQGFLFLLIDFYRFKGGDLKDLIRDVPKLCSINGQIIFGGACFLSVLSDFERIHVYEDTQDLITNAVPSAFCYNAWMPVNICPPKNISQWITDYIPFGDGRILGRWQGKIGKSNYGIWQCTGKDGNEWKCVESEEYDDQKWSNSVMCCYHFGDRIKTILLSIELQAK